MENSLMLRCLMLTIIGFIGYAEGKTDMFELLMSRKQCLKESTKEQCKIEFMKTICANKKSSELGDGNGPQMCKCMERFSRLVTSNLYYKYGRKHILTINFF